MVNGNLKRIIIAAVSENGIIGRENKVPWNVSEELKHFKETTSESAIIFGSKTFESIGKPLKNRINIVISSKSPKILQKNVLYFESVRKAYSYLRKSNYSKVYIGGGAQIYTNTIKHAEEMLISHMNFKIYGDTKFPKINLKLWNIIEQIYYDQFTLIHYSRK